MGFVEVVGDYGMKVSYFPYYPEMEFPTSKFRVVLDGNWNEMKESLSSVPKMQFDKRVSNKIKNKN